MLSLRGPAAFLTLRRGNAHRAEHPLAVLPGGPGQHLEPEGYLLEAFPQVAPGLGPPGLARLCFPYP